MLFWVMVLNSEALSVDFLYFLSLLNDDLGTW